MNETLTNQKFAEQNQEFREACAKSKLPPTKRQASKYRNKTGRAFACKNP